MGGPELTPQSVEAESSPTEPASDGWNAWTLVPAHRVGAVALWVFGMWIRPTLDPSLASLGPVVRFLGGVGIATGVAAAAGAQLAGLRHRSDATRHGLLAGAVVTGWLSSALCTLLPLREAFAPEFAPGPGVM